MIIYNVIGDSIIVSSSRFEKEYSFLKTPEKLASIKEICEKSETVRSLTDLKALEEAIKALAVTNYKETVEAFHPNIHVNKATGTFHLKTAAGVVVKTPMPEVLVKYIERCISNENPVDPIIRFWTRALRNHQSQDPYFLEQLANYIAIEYVVPEVRDELIANGLSYELASERAKTPEIKLTTQGQLLGYKAVNEVEHKYITDEEGEAKKVKRFTPVYDELTGELISDNRNELDLEDRSFLPHIQGMSGDAFYCTKLGSTKDKPGHIVKVGSVIELPSWDMVNCDSTRACLPGLHIGSLTYLHAWQNGNNVQIVNTIVDPMDIGAVCDYNGHWAMRVLRYFVEGHKTVVGTNLYHPSEYAAYSDKQWEAALEEIVKAHGELVESANEELNLAKSLK